MAFLEQFINKHKIQIGLEKIKLHQGDTSEIFAGIFRNYEALRRWVLTEGSPRQYQTYYENYKKLLGSHEVLTYEFTDIEHDRIQELINELREAIKQDEFLEKDHRRRMLNRVNQIQKEFDKTMSNIDVFLGIMVDFSSAIGTCGENIKPMIDRVREVLDIVSVVAARAQGIDVPLALPNYDDSAKQLPKATAAETE